MGERAAFAAGCFWGVEQSFRGLPGVVATGVGFAGGHLANPDYETVCGGRTGHAETVLVEFDPKVTSYADLLTHFWTCHDPTQRDRQGPDVGSQYRSVIFTQGEAQARQAGESLAREQASGKYRRPIATEIVPLDDFWPAGDEHQQYYEKRVGGALLAP
jgi:peptide-methionine (S)-S-oxide reductase